MLFTLISPGTNAVWPEPCAFLVWGYSSKEVGKQSSEFPIKCNAVTVHI